MLNLAFIGNGKSTNRYHLPFVLKLKDKFRVKTIFSRHMKDDWARIKDVHYTTDINEIYADPSINLVVVTTPPQFHYQYAKEVLERGKNVLVEKPFTQTAKEAESLFALAKEKGLFIQCYQNRRYDSDFLTVQKVINSKVLGKLMELEMHFDYFRPEVPRTVHEFSQLGSFVYSHACHTLDQVISLFGKPDDVHYDVRQLLGTGRMNDYFDIDLYYGGLKVSVKSSYFRIKPRPSFVVYGQKGMFLKKTKDRQEEHLKMFYMPDHADFGVDLPQHYGTVTYIDDAGKYHEEKVVSEVGDYSRVYQDIYDTLVHGKQKTVKDEETILQIKMLEEAVAKITA